MRDVCRYLLMFPNQGDVMSDIDNEEEAIKELQNRRQIHAQRSDERQKFSLTILTAGTGVLLAIVAAAERRDLKGVQADKQLYWMLPVFVISLWAFDIRFRVHSARAEELMQRLYDTAIQRRIGSASYLDGELIKFRDDHIQFYSQTKGLSKSTEFIKVLSNVPLLVIFLWSLSVIIRPDGVPRPWKVPPVLVFWLGPDGDRIVWVSALSITAVAVDVIRRWRAYRFKRACRILEKMTASRIHRT